MVARDTLQFGSSSDERNSSKRGVPKLLNDVVLVEQVFELLELGESDAESFPHDWEVTLSQMPLEQLAVLLERAVLHFITRR